MALASGLGGCGSISIPLGSLWSKNDEATTTGSIAAAAPVEVTALPPLVTPAKEEASFSLDAPTGAVTSKHDPLRDASGNATFDEANRSAVTQHLAALFEGQPATATQGWTNPANGHKGLVMRTQDGESASNCHSILISQSAGGTTDWFRTTSCHVSRGWSLGPVSSWRG